MGKQKTKKSRKKGTATTGVTAVSEDFAGSSDEVREKVPTVSQETVVADGDSAGNPLELSPISRMSGNSIDLKLLFGSHEQEIEDESNHEILPWLASSGGGPSVKSSDDFDMDASFVTSNFDLATVASDMDDDSQNRETGRCDASPAEDVEDKLAETLSKQGIRLIIEIDEDDKSWGVMSDLSLSNQSYILDLALQKHSREQDLKEESLEEAFVLYSEAKKKGHKGEGFFLMLLAEVQAKKRASKTEFYKIQDERLDRALDDELQRQSRMASISFGSLPAGTKRTSERVDDVIMERRRTSKMSVVGKVASTREAIIQAASELVIEMSDDGDYEWGNDNGSEDGARSDVTGPKKGKKKNDHNKKKKKIKDGKSKKKKKSTSKTETKPISKDSPSQDPDKKPKKSSGKKLKKSVKGDSIDRKPEIENEDGQDSTISARPKIAKERNEKSARKKKTKKNATAENEGLSGTGSISTSKGNDLTEELVNSHPPVRVTPADIPTKKKQRVKQKRPSNHIFAADEVVCSGTPENIPNGRKPTGKPVPTRKRISGLLASIFGRKGHRTPGEDAPKKGALFGRGKSKGDDTDPSKR